MIMKYFLSTNTFYEWHDKEFEFAFIGNPNILEYHERLLRTPHTKDNFYQVLPREYMKFTDDVDFDKLEKNRSLTIRSDGVHILSPHSFVARSRFSTRFMKTNPNSLNLKSAVVGISGNYYMKTNGLESYYDEEPTDWVEKVLYKMKKNGLPGNVTKLALDWNPALKRHTGTEYFFPVMFNQQFQLLRVCISQVNLFFKFLKQIEHRFGSVNKTVLCKYAVLNDHEADTLSTISTNGRLIKGSRSIQDTKASGDLIDFTIDSSMWVGMHKIVDRHNRSTRGYVGIDDTEKRKELHDFVFP